MDRTDPPRCCHCCYRRWVDEQRKLDRELHDPSRFRPDIIRRLWAHVLHNQGDPARWRGDCMEAMSPPHIAALPPFGHRPVTPKDYDRVTFKYRRNEFPSHVVETVECEGLRLWERITKP